MLELDLTRLRASRSVQLVQTVPPDVALFEDSDVRFGGPLRVEVDAQLAGSDVVVRGHVQGILEGECRRCLKELELPFDEEIAALYSAHVAETDDGADAENVYPLPRDARMLDLGPMVRELTLLAVPLYALCDAVCRGICAGCGVDLNEGECECEAEAVDERWTPFHELKRD